MDSLAGRRILVTAAAAGLGRRMVEAFVEAEAAVHVCDLDEEALAKLLVELPAVSTTLADVARPEEVERLFDEALTRLGGLDVLVNNAGVAGEVGPVDQLDVDDWQRTLAVNLSGAFYCCRCAVPALERSGGGAIVNIASTAGLYGFPLRASYAASKWGLIGLTRTLATELGPLGIRVNAVCPGSVAGPRIERVIAAEAAARGLGADEVRAGYRRQSSLETLIDADDVASLVLFLCSDQGARISGQAIAVDGNTQSVV